MAQAEQVLQPIAFALHTRNRETDYCWSPEIGQALLLPELKELHRQLIADLDANPESPATFLLLDKGARIGLVLGNLKTNRRDHLNTRIDDTVLLEFDAAQRSSVYYAAAGLLDTMSAQIQQCFLAYAEDFFHRKYSTLIPLITPSLPVSHGSFSDLLESRHIALRSHAATCRRVASLLTNAAEQPQLLGSHVLIVSTGHVGRDKLQKLARQYKGFIALSRSASIPEGQVVTLTPDKKGLSKSFLAAITSLILISGTIWLLATHPFSSRPLTHHKTRASVYQRSGSLVAEIAGIS
ncbi:MAG: hypothetical protein RMJ88_16395, partial [Thermogemmata sp.]|nr:hypothetical protein [Thermogemmata sp.]